MSAILLTNNPIKSRFSDAISGNVYLFKQDNFSPDIYFNGIQFRLLIWRFTYEILQQNKAWLLGVSTGDAQYELNKKFAETNIYLGDGKKDKLGYGVFNCHNVFLQTTLESGLIGLCFLLGIIFTFLIQAFKKQETLTIIFFLAILAFCFTESVLSSQYTILLFMFFPLLSLNVQHKNS
jgi:O-antigen ligase